MSRCIIHIGMHKTGSTSIQRSLDGLDDDRFLYADVEGLSNHSGRIYTAFAANPARHRRNRLRGLSGSELGAYVNQVRVSLDRAVDQSNGRTLLFSGEGIGSLESDALSRMRDYFCHHFREVTIVGYVRPPAAYMSSVFQQRVKGGSMKRFDVGRLYRGFKDGFLKFDEVFGRDNVKLWKFDPKAFPNGDVVQDFCQRIGIRLPSERIVRLNDSLTRELVCLLYTYQTLSPTYKELANPRAARKRIIQLVTRLGGIGTRRFRFSPGVVQPVLEANREDIAWMEARLGAPLQEELGKHQDGDVRDEWDLLWPEPRVVGQLLDRLGAAAPRGNKGKTPEQVAALLDAQCESADSRSTSNRRSVDGEQVPQARPGEKVSLATL